METLFDKQSLDFTLENKLDFSSISTEQLEQEVKDLESIMSFYERMEEKFLSRGNAFKQLDLEGKGQVNKKKFLEFIQKNNLSNANNSMIFEKISLDGSITEDSWNQGYFETSYKISQNKHKMSILQKRKQVLGALDRQNENSKKYVDEQQPSIVDESRITGTKYQSIMEKFKNTSSLGDISDIFAHWSQNSPPRSYRKDLINVVPDLVSTQEVQPKRNLPKFIDEQFSSIRTPPHQEDLQQRLTTENSGRGSFFLKDFEVKFAQSRLTHQQRSPSKKATSPAINLFIPSIATTKTEIPSKIQQKMNVFPEAQRDSVRSQNKSSRRKDDFNQFMSKVGFGKYEAPRVTVNLEKIKDQPKEPQHKSQIERMKSIIQFNNPQSPTANLRAGSQNLKSNNSSSNLLDSLLQNPKFSQGSFRQNSFRQPRPESALIQQPQRNSTNRSTSLGKEAFNLVDQSLKNYTMKLIHKHKYGEEKVKETPRSQIPSNSFKQKIAQLKLF